MNNFEEPFDEQSADSTEFSGAEIDRLVDGELSKEQQRSLLQRLENSSAGWRELALAYVEASVWKDQFSLKMPNAADSGAAPLPSRTETIADRLKSADQSSAHGPSERQQSKLASAFAALAVLIVFGLGIWLGRTQVDLPAQPSRIADNEEFPATNDTEFQPQDRPDQPPTTVAKNVDLSLPKTVQVVYSDGQSDVLRVVDVPLSNSVAFESQQPLDEFWNRRGSAIPAELRAELEKSGHKIRESRDFWPAQLPDGRAVVIPVSQVHVANNPLAYP